MKQCKLFLSILFISILNASLMLTASSQVLDPTHAFSGAQYSSIDTTLTTANICSGKNFFGVAGTAICQQGSSASPAATPAVFSGQEYWDSTGAKRVGTMVNRGSPTFIPTTLDQNITTGYYSGGTVLGDASLTSGNIAFGSTIFGVVGLALIESHTNCTAANQTGCLSTVNYKTQSVPATPALAANVMSGKEFYAGGAMLTGTMVDRGSWNFDTTSWPSAGYYSGFTTSLTAADVCSSKQILGVQGTAICRIDAPTIASKAGAAQIRNGYEAWDKDGNRISGSMIETATWDLLTSFPGAGFIGDVSNLPTANQIVSGITILGVAGIAPNSWNQFAPSYIARDPAAVQVLQVSELKSGSCDVGGYSSRELCEQYGAMWTPTALAGNYREIPSAVKDVDGVNGSIVKYAPRPLSNCGTTQAGIEARIADCFDLNGARGIWDGSVMGNSGQAIWKLVTRAAANREVWKDMRTGLLWSSVAYNGAARKTGSWCKSVGSRSHTAASASISNFTGALKGSITIVSLDDYFYTTSETYYYDQASGGFYHLDSDLYQDDLIPIDGSNYHSSIAGGFTVSIVNTGAAFDNGDRFTLDGIGSTGECPTSHQPQVSPVSYCVEQAAPIVKGFTGDNWAAGTYDNSKGGMGANNATTKVRWRVPTLNDYLQAELDGIIMVMPDMGKAGATRSPVDGSPGGGASYEWTASAYSENTNNAWGFLPASGYAQNYDRTNSFSTRCVGR